MIVLVSILQTTHRTSYMTYPTTAFFVFVFPYVQTIASVSPIAALWNSSKDLFRVLDELNKAYNILSDQQKRERYDEKLLVIHNALDKNNSQSKVIMVDIHGP